MFAKLISAGSSPMQIFPRCRSYGYTPTGICISGINPTTGLCGEGLVS